MRFLRSRRLKATESSRVRPVHVNNRQMPVTEAEQITCTKCKREHKATGKRLPVGWKRWRGDLYCNECRDSLFILRAISIPIAEPLDADWKALRGALKLMWRQTTQASNWIMTELYARDVRRGPADEKIPPMAKTYLYPEIRVKFPDLPPQTVASLEQAITRKYRAKRYEIIWTCASSLPTTRYPAPFPVHNQSWSIAEEDERPVVTARVGEQKIRFKLRGGARFRRQLVSVGHMIDGSAIRGELALLEKGTDIVCKMVAWLPRTEPKTGRAGVLIVRTMPDSLLVALNAKDDVLWTYNADHLVRWQAEHRNTLQRLAEDQKFEQRPVPSFEQLRDKLVERQYDRMRTAVQEIAAHLVGYAARRRFAAIRYNDGEHSFCQSFPWFAMRDRIATVCGERNIVFEHVPASSETATKSPEPLVL
jgi:hypothetical protein